MNYYIIDKKEGKVIEMIHDESEGIKRAIRLSEERETDTALVKEMMGAFYRKAKPQT
jgi:hypothetical protein